MNIIKIKTLSKVPKNYTGIVEYPNGTKVWYLNGLCHREDGPAIEYFNGGKEWRCHGLIHRVDGPAIEGSNGSKDWCLNGIYLSQEEWFERLSKEDKLNVIWGMEKYDSKYR
jgi:hypothetical protein